MAPIRNRKPKEKPDTAIPRFTIDLSLHPEDRYVALAKHYRPQIQRLLSLFDDLLSDLGVPRGLHKSINQVARLLLRRVHSPVETAELGGISKAADVPMYLLVSLNLVLDLLMGCTSGAVKSRGIDQDSASARMLHFRTLDWGMDPLRSVIVQLDYVESNARTSTRVLGSSISYVGFVGVLTGVREGLSLSLNFRAVHDASTKTQQFRFYLHHILVLLGLRQSISSLLRSCLFGHERDWTEKPSSLEAIMKTIPPKHTTAAYLIFCDGRESISMEKDFDMAITRGSESFIVATNHDLNEHPTAHGTFPGKNHAVAMRDLLDESEDRRNCMVRKWQAKLRKERRAQEAAVQSSRQAASAEPTRTRTMRSGDRSFDSIDHQDRIAFVSTVVDHNEAALHDIEQTMTVTREELIKWTTSFPTTNECTHFATILDPSTGTVLWAQRYLQPVEVPSDEAPRVDLDQYVELD